MKHTVYKTLFTPHAASISENPHSYYPRPQMVRDSFYSLNGTWSFGLDPSCGESILVPFVPESILSGVEMTPAPGCTLYYKKSFSLPEKFNTGRVILHFDAVDTVAEVTLNGKLLGTHEGGYHPFSFDITDILLETNELFLCVRDDLSGLYPYGKQSKKRGGMWYTPHSGIWQSVWIESVPEEYVKEIKISADAHSVTVCTEGGIAHKTLTLRDTGEVLAFDGDTVTFTPKSLRNWSPEDPYLYYFTLECGEDKIESYFALREIGVACVNGVPRLTLNGQPYLFNGLLDQGYYPDGIILPASIEGYRDDIMLAKRLGFNMLRKHIKVEPLVFYHLCDTLGIVVFQDMVNSSDYSFMRDTALPTVGFKSLSDKKRHTDKNEREIFTREALATVGLLNNSPSVLYYTVFNEGWGQFSADEQYALIKKHADGRIVDATSGWFVQTESDVDSRHVYFKTPNTKHPHPTRPLVISEFGGFSHRVEGHLFGSKNYGYKTFAKREDFECALTELYESLKPLVKERISALVLTQLSDVEDETNGLVTYDRAVVKVDEASFSCLMKELSSEI